MAGSQAVFDLQPGTDVSQVLQFQPISVIVDNYSPYWIYLPDAGRYVPPYTTGGAYPLKYAQGAKIQWTAPNISGIAQLPFIATAGLAHFNFTDDELVYSPATAIPNQVFLQSQAYTINEGQTLDLTATPLDFLAMGVRIDNPGGTTYALGNTGITAPQWTVGFTVDVLPPFNSIVIAPTTDPAGRSNTTRGGPVTITFYAAQIGNSPGIALPVPTDIYLANNMAIYPGATDLNAALLCIAGVTAGNIVYLRNLSVTIPASTVGISQGYSLYQSTGTILGGKMVTPSVLDPSSPALPATVYRARARSEGSTALTRVGVLAAATLLANQSFTANAPTHNVGDVLICFHACGDDNVATNAVPTGWTSAQSSGYSAGSGSVWGEILTRIADGTAADNCTITQNVSLTGYHKAVIVKYDKTMVNSITLNGTAGSTTYNLGTTTSIDLAGITPTNPYNIMPWMAIEAQAYPATFSSASNCRALLIDNTTFAFAVGDDIWYSGPSQVVSSIFPIVNVGTSSTSFVGLSQVIPLSLLPNTSFIIPTLGLKLADLSTASAGSTTVYDIRTILGVVASATAGVDLVLVSNGGANLNETISVQLSIEP